MIVSLLHALQADLSVALVVTFSLDVSLFPIGDFMQTVELIFELAS